NRPLPHRLVAASMPDEVGDRRDADVGPGAPEIADARLEVSRQRRRTEHATYLTPPPIGRKDCRIEGPSRPHQAHARHAPRVCAGESLANGAHAVSANTTPRCARVGARTAERTTSASRNVGNAWTRSHARPTARSNRPRPTAAAAPRGQPTTKPTSATTTAR